MGFVESVRAANERRRKWDARYMDLARSVSEWSKDPSSHVGSVVVGEHGQILATGYNGLPRKIEDTEERLLDRDTKLKLTIHGEMNCIFNASLSGISLDGATMYVYGLPTCTECAKGIIQSGINRLVILKNDIEKSDRWKESWEMSRSLFAEADVSVTVLE